MVGILVATHGDFATGLMSAVELVLGKQEQLITMGLHHGDGAEEFEHQMMDAINTLDDGDGVIVFVDILGGTPSNTVFKCLRKKNFKAIAEVNLPMILQTCVMRPAMNLDDLFNEAVEVAKRPPVILSEMFEEMNNDVEDDDL